MFFEKHLDNEHVFEHASENADCSMTMNSQPKRFVWKIDCLQSFMKRWNHPDITTMKNKLSNVLQELHVDQAVAALCDIFTFVGKSMCRTKKHYCSAAKNHDSWFDDDCLQFKNLVQRKLIRFRLSRSEEALMEYKVVKQQYKNLLKKKKYTFRVEKQKFLLDSLYSHDVKSFWAQLKSSSQSVSQRISIDQWYNYFSSLFNPGKDDGDDYIEIIESEHPADYLTYQNNSDNEWNNFLNAKVSEDEVTTAINSLKCGKATGIDGIPAEFLKYSPKMLIEILVNLFNAILSSGCFPLQWATGLIVPIFKKGGREEPGNYRGISLISVMCKVFSGVLLNRLNFWADAVKFFCQEQAGFRKGFRTTDNIFILHTVINKYLSRKKGRLYVAFVDFRKAFDSISH